MTLQEQEDYRAITDAAYQYGYDNGTPETNCPHCMEYMAHGVWRGPDGQGQSFKWRLCVECLSYFEKPVPEPLVELVIMV